MTDLLKPRYLVMADYPFSQEEIGSVLTANDREDKEYLDKYPAIFRLLNWHEYLPESDLPKYVKNIKRDKVFKVADKSQDNRLFGHKDDEIEHRILLFNLKTYGDSWIPAREQEYLTFINKDHG